MSHSKSKDSSGFQYKIQVLDRTLDILECFTFNNREMSLTEIVRKTGLNKNSHSKTKRNKNG